MGKFPEEILEMELLTLNNILRPPITKKEKSKPELTPEEIKEKQIEMKKDWAKMQKHALDAQRKLKDKTDEKQKRYRTSVIVESI